MPESASAVSQITEEEYKEEKQMKAREQKIILETRQKQENE